MTYILDQSKPKITISSPAKNAVVNGATVTITGQTQAGSAISARDEANAQTAVATADNSGKFSVVVPIAAGINGINVTATDPAGNTASAVISVQRGSGKLTIKLTASTYHFSANQDEPDHDVDARARPERGAPGRGDGHLQPVGPGHHAGDHQDADHRRAAAGSPGRRRSPKTVPGKGEIAAMVQTTDYGQMNAQLPLTFNWPPAKSTGRSGRRLAAAECPPPCTLGWTIARAASYHRAMPMWRCPHCATPQAEAARCWVCHRSTTSCASCRNFRRSITAGVGYCAT